MDQQEAVNPFSLSLECHHHQMTGIIAVDKVGGDSGSLFSSLEILSITKEQLVTQTSPTDLDVDALQDRLVVTIDHWEPYRGCPDQWLVLLSQH